MVTVGEVLSLHIDKPAAGGRMIARAAGQIVFVAGAIPGERVSARVTRVAKGVAYADCLSVEEASPDRRTALTDAACGGSAFAHIDYPRQLAIKAEIVTDGLTRIGRLTPPATVRVAPSQPEGYRMRARLHAQAGRVGFFREGSHELCDPRDTRQLLDETCDVLDAVAGRLRALRLDSIHELEIAENVEASARVVHLIATSALQQSSVSGFDAIAGLSGMVLTAPEPPRQAPETRLVTGDPYVFDRLSIEDAEIVLRRHVRAFFQGNRHLLRTLVSHVMALVPRGAQTLDLYAGVGVFAIAAAVLRQTAVIAVEGDPYAARDLAINADRVGGVEVHHQAVEDFLSRRGSRPEVVILDPPRTGLSREALRRLIDHAAERLIYVSCDVATLARDLRVLVESGYEMRSVDGFDLFPNTPHVETVAHLVRPEASR
jgi:23S rRNA (uracil1939-C5)-methyltransferase